MHAGELPLHGWEEEERVYTHGLLHSKWVGLSFPGTFISGQLERLVHAECQT